MRLVTQIWNHTEPDDETQQHDLQLLTIGGISVLGRWQGALGEYFVGWATPAYVTLQPCNHINNQQAQNATPSLS